MLTQAGARALDGFRSTQVLLCPARVSACLPKATGRGLSRPVPVQMYRRSACTFGQTCPVAERSARAVSYFR